MSAAAKEWQYTTRFRYLQPGEVGVVGKSNLGGWHMPVMHFASKKPLLSTAFEPKGKWEL